MGSVYYFNRIGKSSQVAEEMEEVRKWLVNRIHVPYSYIECYFGVWELRILPGRGQRLEI